MFLMNIKKPNAHAALILICISIAAALLPATTKAAESDPNSQIPLKWAVIIMGGYNYYRDLTYNSIQRIERIMQGRGVPYDLFQDDMISGPSDTNPPGRYSLQFANGLPKYQAIVLLLDYEPTDSTAANQQHIYWAVGNGTNAIIFNRAANAVPALLNLASSDVGFEWRGLTVSARVIRTFFDGVKEYREGTSLTFGLSLYTHAVIRKHTGMTLWFNKTWSGGWSVGMANMTYGSGKVWYLGYGLNEFAMEYAPARYPATWTEYRMDFWGHAFNFAFNNIEEIPVKIMPFKRWKGAWIIRIDTDTYRWRSDQLPPESVLQSGWVFDYQYSVLGYGRTSSVADLTLTSGAPSGYTGMPSSRVMYTDVTGVLQTNLRNSRTYRAIIYNSTLGGNYDRIKLDFNQNNNFGDDVSYKMWENMTYQTVQGKLYWCAISPDFSQPQRINIGWWQTPMLIENEGTNLPRWRQYAADYGLSYSFHGWQHVRLADGSSYAMWNGASFVLNTTYIRERYEANRYWMKDKFGGTGYGFEEDQVIISHPYDNHPPEADAVIDSLPWVLFQYDGKMYYVGFGKKSETSKYTLSSANEEFIYPYDRFAPLEDMVKTVYPVVSTFTHRLNYNTSFSFPEYTDSIKPANPREAFVFWQSSRNMLQTTSNAYYSAGKITLEFDAPSDLEDYVWKFPTQVNGRSFSNFVDNRSIGQLKHTDDKYIYIEFNKGQGGQKLEVVYGPPVPTVTVDVSAVSPSSSGTTTPTIGTYTVAENSLYSITATPNTGFVFDHWELDGVNAGSINPYSFNVSTSSHSIGAFFAPVPTVTVTVGVSPPSGGTASPAVGQHQVPENSLFTVSSTPSTFYAFDHWELDGSNVGSANPYSFNVATTDHAISAFFTSIPTATVTISDVSPINSGTTSPAAGVYTVVQNTVFSIGATQLSGYTFDHWELDGASVSTQPSYSFNVGTSDHTVAAFFTRITTAQIDSGDSLSGWWATAATLSVDNADFQEGAGAIVVTASSPPPWHSYATMQRAMNFSAYSSLQMWIKVSDASKPLRLMVATSWSNYNIYTITGLTSNSWTLASIDLSAPTSRTGTVNFNSISFIRFDWELRASAGYFKIDDIRGVYR